MPRRLFFAAILSLFCRHIGYYLLPPLLFIFRCRHAIDAMPCFTIDAYELSVCCALRAEMTDIPPRRRHHAELPRAAAQHAHAAI